MELARALTRALTFKTSIQPHYSPRYKPAPEVEETNDQTQVEVSTRPLVEIATISEKKKANRINYALVLGGEIINDQGKPVKVAGVAERALRSLDQELEDFDARTTFFQEEIAQVEPEYGPRKFLGLINRPSNAQSNAEKVLLEKKVEQKAANQELRRQIAQKREIINQLLSEKYISGEVLGIWNNLVDIEKYIRQNPGTEDFTTVQKQLDYLKIDPTKRASDEGLSPREYLELLINDTGLTSPGFSEYKDLRLGSSDADKGLNTLQEELNTQTTTQQEELAKLYPALAQSQEKKRILEQDQTNVNLSSSKRAEMIRDLDVIEEATDFIRNHYLIEDSEISGVEDEISRLTQMREGLINSFTEAIRLSKEVNSMRKKNPIKARLERDVTPAMEKQLKKDTNTLDERLRDLRQQNIDLFNIRKRLSGAPPELKKALELVSRPDFDLDQMPKNKRRINLLDHKNSGRETYITALVEMATVLSGKGKVRINQAGEQPPDVVINEQTTSIELSEQAKTAPEKVLEALIKGGVNVGEFSQISSPVDDSDPIYLNTVNDVQYSPEDLANTIQTKAASENLSDQDTETYIYQLILAISKDIYKAIYFQNNTIKSESINLINQQELEKLCKDINMNTPHMEIVLRLSELIYNLVQINESIRIFGLGSLKS